MSIDPGLAAIIAAVITSIGAIVAASIKIRAKNETPTRGVFITSPKDEDRIAIAPSETEPIRSISGRVFGFSEKELRLLKLEVWVEIKTDEWYRQGQAILRDDGSWELDKAWFYGTRPSIRAILKVFEPGKNVPKEKLISEIIEVTVTT